MAATPANWSDTVLRFWFEEATPEQWFKKSDAFDAVLRGRFLELYEALAKRAGETFLADDKTARAAIIVFDQMPRNMFRGQPRAFATDAKALAIAKAAVERRFDAGLTKNERLFVYLPFEHAEAPDMQARCIALMATLADPDLLKWAEAHKAIIDRFGRFPHRNAILGRASTEEELRFLTEPGSSF
jgi:uncharacterized protein (DUF924 family)